MQNRILFVFLASMPFIFGGCTKCVTCDIDLKQGFLNVATIDEYCGTSDDIDEEENRLIQEEYACIECIVNTSFGQSSSGFLCGDRNFTDSVNDTWRDGAVQAGLQYDCVYYRDTLEVVCILKN
jgi:hypothetical protein